MSARTRVTMNQLVELGFQLGERDQAIIATLDRVRLATARQLERLHFTDGTPVSNARQTRRALERLVGLRVLTRLERRVGGVRAGSSGFVYALDVAGQRLVRSPEAGRYRSPWTPGAVFVTHVLQVSDLYVQLVEAERRGDLELLEFDAEPRCWRAFAGPGGGRLTLKPDAYLRVGVGSYEHAWFVEVDRATESPHTLERKLNLYRRYWGSGREQARHNLFPLILFLVPHLSRQGVALELCRRQPAESRTLFRVALYEQALPILRGGEHG